MNKVWSETLNQGPLAVNRLAKGVDDTSQPTFIRIYNRLGDAYLDPATQPDPIKCAKRHGQRLAVSEPDHLAYCAQTIPIYY